MRKGILIISHEDIAGEMHYYGYALVGRGTLSLTNYNLLDNSMNQKNCDVEDDGRVVTKLVVDGIEIPSKQVVSPQVDTEVDMNNNPSYLATNERFGADELNQCTEPESERREAYAYWHACKRVSEGVEKYSEQVNIIPLLIKNNGLGSALMYMRTQKNRGALSMIYNDICDWLKVDNKQLIDLEGLELAEKIIEVPQHQYKDITKEVLAYLAFLKRFAKGLSS